MIISKTPLRISFVGGGSDLPSFYEQSEGAVVTATINKHIYITVSKKFDNHIRISYSKTEDVEDINQIQHPIVRAVLEKLNIGGIEITSISDIPSRGSGLGSSSAFTVGLLHALYTYKKMVVFAQDLAREACEIEIDILNEPVGRQDQYGTSFGGFKFLRFHQDGQVSVELIPCLRQTRDAIEKNILLLYTGVTRSTSRILKKQKSNIRLYRNKRSTMEKMVQLSYELFNELKKDTIRSFGEILHANWMYKRELAKGVTSPEIDKWYGIARKHGAEGGKILGAGGGGFMLLYAPHEKHEEIKQSLSELRSVDFQFENQGSQIIFNY